MARTTTHPKEESFNFRVPADLKAAFQKVTEREDKPAAQVIRDFMRAYVIEHEEPELGHSDWFRKQVYAAINTPSTSVRHQDVIKNAREAVKKLSKHDNEDNLA